MMAQVCDLEPGTFVHTFGHAYIYSNHFDQVAEQFSRTPEKLPSMQINSKIKDIFQFSYDDFTLLDYHPQASFKDTVTV